MFTIIIHDLFIPLLLIAMISLCVVSDVNCYENLHWVTKCFYVEMIDYMPLIFMLNEQLLSNDFLLNFVVLLTKCIVNPFLCFCLKRLHSGFYAIML